MDSEELVAIAPGDRWDRRATFPCRAADLQPGRDLDLAALRTLGATGAPPSKSSYRWSTTPKWAGEISAPCSASRSTGMGPGRTAGHRQVGELVVTQPMPSMLTVDTERTRVAAIAVIVIRSAKPVAIVSRSSTDSPRTRRVTRGCGSTCGRSWRRTGRRSRSTTDWRSTSLMTRRCGSPTRRSTRPKNRAVAVIEQPPG